MILTKDDQKSRLGSLLVKNHAINQDDLKNALAYQQKRKIKLGTALLELHLVSRYQIKIALKKQLWMRTFATLLTLIFAPFNHVFAENQSHNKVKKQLVSQRNGAFSNQDLKGYIGGPIVSHYNVDYGQWDRASASNFSYKQSFTKQTGFKISFFAPYAGNDDQVNYNFEPQISLFKSSSISIRKHYNGLKDIQNRYTQSSPTTYMVTLKGRCLYENAGDSSKIWGLNRADIGVQRNAELMFSVTKLF